MGYDSERAEYSLYDEEYQEAMAGPDNQPAECGCDISNIYYDKELDLYCCGNCRWTSL